MRWRRAHWRFSGCEKRNEVDAGLSALVRSKLLIDFKRSSASRVRA